MKKLLVSLLILLTLFTAAPVAEACRRHRHARSYYTRAYYPRYTRARYVRSYPAYSGRTVYYARDRRSFWQRHRDKLTVAIGTGYGAGLGALIGGRRGAAIGALAGGGGSAPFTHPPSEPRPPHPRDLLL